MPTSPERRARAREWVVWGGALLLLALTVGEVVSGRAAPVAKVLVLVTAAAFIGSGAVLLARRPENPVSWLLALPPLYFAGDAVGDVGVALLDGRPELWVRWAEQALFAPTMFTVAALLPVLFPTGRAPTPRWRWVVVAGTVGAIGLSIGNAMAPDLLSAVDGGLENPAAVLPDGVADVLLGVGLAAFLAGFLGGVVAMVVRTRRASGIERQQLRWVARAGVGALVAWGAAGILESRGVSFSGEVFVAGLALLPVATAVAVLRYRLYDLDRVVSRTITWASVSGVLGVVYVVVVVGVQGLLGGREVPDVVVAGSTLLVAGLVRPVHGRLQVVVDRRFNRARVTAQRVVDDFTAHLRDQVDPVTVELALRRAVVGAVAPASAWVWTAGGEGTG